MKLELLKSNASLEDVIKTLNDLIKAQNDVESKKGPKSEREMTDSDARRVISGDLKDLSHKLAAEKLNLSYAQIYSCRKEFTFKHIHKELKAKV